MNAKKIDELCEFISGLWTGKKPPYINVGVIRNTNFQKNGDLDFTDIALLDVEEKQFKSRQLQYGDIVLEKSGGGPKQPVGRVCVFEKNEGLYSLSNFTSAIRVKNKNELDYKYLHYYLRHLYISGETEKIQTNSTGIRNLQLSLYKEFVVPLPSLATQKKIVIKLDAIFAEIDRAVLATEANVKNAEALFKSYLTEAFDFSENDLVKLSSITTDITDGDHQPPPKATEGVSFITISNVDKETRLIDFSQTFKVSREYFESLKENRKPKNGDVLYTVTGSFGIPIHVNDDVEFCFQRHIGLLRPSEKVSSKWLYWLMLSPQIFQQAKNSATGAAQLTVSLKAIRNFMVPSISLDEQLKVVKHLDECFSIYTNLRNSYLKKIKAINASKNLFLKQAFNGELVKD